jgi:hypothetical protein
MASLNQIYAQWLDETQKKLIDEYNKLGFRASGRYARELEPFQTQTKIGMLGANYSEYMARGRGETRPGLRGRLYGVILQWINDKGITPKEATMTKKTLAWIIAMKIDKVGYSVKGREGVISNVVNDAWVAELFRRISNQEIERVRIELTQLLKAA